LNDSAHARWLKTMEVFNEHGEAQQLKLFPSEVEPSPRRWNRRPRIPMWLRCC
jgi:hypothetical protein